ncbi:hypothetical protein V5O48_004148, partial [Marasmius crinis-equi]
MDIAKACAGTNSLVASFLFSRSDPKRNNPSFLFLSIANDLTTSIPSLSRVINKRIASNPRIINSRWEEQFRELVIKPSLKLAPDPSVTWFRQALKRILPKESPPSHKSNPSTGGSRTASKTAISKQSPPTHYPNLVIIDGLDECNNIETQLRVLSTIFSAFEASPSPPLRFLICSRPKPWIREALYSERYHLLAKHIVLDNDSHTGNDIEKYLLHEFHDISISPKYRHIRFPNPWPSHDVVARFTQNSCGEHVYVVTVIRWIKTDGFHPLEQLRIILDQSPNQGTSSPHRELDNVYHIILSVHPDPKTLRLVLGAILFLPHIDLLPRYGERPLATPDFIDWVLGLPCGQVLMTLRSTHSVLSIGERHEEIHVFHTSFRDFLCDESRSGDFFLDEYSTKQLLLRQWLQRLIARCYYRSDQTFTNGRSLPLPYDGLWAAWFAFAHGVPDALGEVLSDLETLDLSAPSSMALFKGHDPYFCSWYDIFEIFGSISSWLKKRK